MTRDKFSACLIFKTFENRQKWPLCNKLDKINEVERRPSSSQLDHVREHNTKRISIILFFSGLNGCYEKNVHTKSDFRNYSNCSERTHAEILKVIILRNLTKINIVFFNML